MVLSELPSSRLQVLRGLGGGDWFDAHREKGAEKKKERAPKLRIGEALAKNPRGEGERAGGTKQLERLRECDADLLDSDVIQDVRQGDAAHGGNDEDEIHICVNP